MRSAPVVREYSSRARSDVTSLFWWTPLRALRDALAPLGLAIEPVHGAPRSAHPIWIDLAHIKEGAGEAGQRDQHAWWRRTGATAGGALGWLSGVSSASLLHASTRSFELASRALGSAAQGPLAAAAVYAESLASSLRSGGLAGASLGEALGVGLSAQLSQGLSRSLGSYREVIVAAPNVTSVRRPGTRYCFVLGMYTDSPIAVWGDRALRYGYGKHLCRLDSQRFESYRVEAPNGSAVLRAEIAISSPESWRRPRQFPGFAHLLQLCGQPLLGTLNDGSFAVSLLERDYADEKVGALAPCAIELELATDLAGGLRGGAASIEALSRQDRFGAFSAHDVPTRVTFPEHRSLLQL